MAKFRYVAMDSKGTEVQGTVDADSQAQAIAAVRARGLFPTKVTQQGGAAKGGGRVAGGGGAGKGLSMELKMPKLFQARVKPKQLMVFTRQLATLVDAGLPLLRGLRILLKQEKHPALRDALSGMGEAVEGGGTFSEALAQFPKIFDPLFISMVRAGEAGGVLEVVLDRLAEFMEKGEKIKNKIKSAMVYPIVVLVAAMGILIFLLTSVIPKFEAIFNDLLEGKALPLLTQFVINISNFVKHRGLVVVVVVVVLVVANKMFAKTGTGRVFRDRIRLKMPLFGSMFTKAAIGRLTRTLGTLMSSGVPVLQALNIVRDTAGNEVIAQALQKVHDAVKEGETMAVPFESAGVFPGMVVSMVDVGEETGALPEMLVKIADNYDDEVDTAVEGLTSVLEPIMIIVLALIIGVIVIAMFVPLISIIGSMSA
ncbi:MAG: type II secretion system F family protein [Lentisphaerae bacterium]|nr:type II secretion system F family protein [Lentisphaerota bacterium]